MLTLEFEFLKLNLRRILFISVEMSNGRTALLKLIYFKGIKTKENICMLVVI